MMDNDFTLPLQPELMTRLLLVARGIDNVLIANHSQRHWLNADHPPFGAFVDGKWLPAPLNEGLRRYGPGPVFALWAQCVAVEALSVAWTGRVFLGGLAPPLLADEPDEAPGLALPEPEGNGADQQRLAGTEDHA